MSKQPPNVDGVMTLSDAEKSDILAKLQAIQSAFVASDDVPVCDTFYLVSTYNKQNVGAEINGDTAQFVLTPVDSAQSGV